MAKKNITTEAQNMTAQAQQLADVPFLAVADAIKLFQNPKAISGETLRLSSNVITLADGTKVSMDLCPSTQYNIELFKGFLQNGIDEGVLKHSDDFDADGRHVDVYRVIDEEYTILVTGHVTGPFANIKTVKHKKKCEL